MREIVRFGSAAVMALAMAIAALMLSAPARGAQPGEVLVVPIHGTIDEGMAHLVRGAVAEADTSGAKAIILDLNTPGGLVDAATQIRDALFAARVPVVAYVSERAWSAGALITLAAPRVAMAPGASIGAAEPIPTTIKTVSALRAEFESTAARNGRNPKLAAAMVDSSRPFPPYSEKGQILTLTADQARTLAVSDETVKSFQQLLEDEHFAGSPVRTLGYSFGERLARFATDPVVSGMLLTIGFLGLLIEMQTLHGIAGLIGVAALGLFFGAHVIAGFSNELVIVLAVLGLLALLAELHVFPGHGLFGILGVLILAASVVLAFGIAFVGVAVQALAVAVVATAILFVLSTRIFPQNAFFRRIVFAGAQGPEYIASADYRGYLGANGVALSDLRPSGVAELHGRRLDVLTEGEYVPAGSPIHVRRVEGGRIFVVRVGGVEPHAELPG
ncbi:MAG: ATP-dependent Clp protease proteolytic subunit [bacterium]|nr:ATP-dependent Clp protease proteolytic subunit [bacterium]